MKTIEVFDVDYTDIMEVCENNDLTPAELIDCLMGLIDVVKENNAWD